MPLTINHEGPRPLNTYEKRLDELEAHLFCSITPTPVLWRKVGIHSISWSVGCLISFDTRARLGLLGSYLELDL